MSKEEILITFNGETHTMLEWSKITGISKSRIDSRRKRGFPPEKIFKKGRLNQSEIKRYEWSKSAVDCYNIGCWCKKCDIMPEDLKGICRMKFTVKNLVKKYGAPERNPNRRNDILKSK